MSVAHSPEHRMRMLVWNMAIQGYGWEDIEIKLRCDDLPVPSREFIKTHVVKADGVIRAKQVQR